MKNSTSKIYAASLASFLCLLPSRSNATYTILRDAGTLTRGKLVDDRLDYSSVTCYGSNIPADAIVGQIASTQIVTSSILDRIYDLYAGPPGTPAPVDTYVNDSASFDAMMASAPVNARGLTTNTSAYATIHLSSGIYNISNTTIPAGVTIYATPGSSVIIRPTDTASRIFTVYGTLSNVNFDLQGRAMACEVVFVGTGARINNVTVYGAQNTDQATPGMYTFFQHTYSTDTVVTATFKDYAPAPGDGVKGALATFTYNRKAYVTINGKMGSAASNTKQSYYFQGASDTIVDGIYDNSGGRPFYILGECRGIIIRGEYNITQAFSELIKINPSAVGGTSNTVIDGARFNIYIANANPIISAFNANGTFNEAILIKNCIAKSFSSTSPSFFYSAASNVGTSVLMNNSVYNIPFISDSGNLTTYKGAGNFVDNVLQAAAASGGGVTLLQIEASTPSFPMTLRAPASVYQSTIGPCAVPGACYNTGYDTITIIGLWADQVYGSTQGWTRADIALSSAGAVTPTLNYQFPFLAIGTATTSGNNTFSQYITTGVRVNAWNIISLQITTLPTSGLAPTETVAHLDYFVHTRQRY